MKQDPRQNKAPKQAPDLISLDDLLPQKNIQGGKGEKRVIFGAVNDSRRQRRPGTNL